MDLLRGAQRSRVVHNPGEMLSAVLLDVGGTLWPDKIPFSPGLDPCLEQLSRVLPEVNAAEALAALRGALAQDDTSLVQDTHAVLARAIRGLVGPETSVDPAALRRALCRPAGPGVRPFPGAAGLLATIRRLSLTCVILSNVQVRSAADYWRDFTDLGFAHHVDRIVTSHDVGFRKPHPAMFAAAIREANCDAADCVMVGNSETKDIEPAVAIGMRAIRVAIEEPAPETTDAHAVAESLAAVAAILERWTTHTSAHAAPFATTPFHSPARAVNDT
jgi:putative hydrolase of the HAD superfamily